MDVLSALLSEDNTVTPMGEINGKTVYSFEDIQKVNTLRLAKERLNGKRIDFGERETRQDGLGYTQTKTDVVALPTTFFENRYKKSTFNKETVYEVVTDWRACREQSTGHVYTNNVLVYIIGSSKVTEAEAKQGIQPELVLKGTKQISDTEFIDEYKQKLNQQSMVRIFKLLDLRDNFEEDELQF